ncbi:hypothetical protein SLS61_000034 [Didymella pomorum]
MILTFTLGGHTPGCTPSTNGQVRPRVCPEYYLGLPYAMTLGPRVRITWLLALSYNKFVGYSIPLAALFKRMAPYQVNEIRVVTVNVIAASTKMEGDKMATGLSEEVIEILNILCGMRGL